jgi:hypothetical protein
MSFTVEYDQENRCLISRLTGPMDTEEMGKYSRAIVLTGQEHSCKCLLNDMSQAELDLTTIDIFYLPKTLEAAGIDRSWKRAILFAKDFPSFRFVETRMINEGQLVRIFQDHDAAIEWLVSKAD